MKASLPGGPMKASLPGARMMATAEGEAIGIELDGALRVRTDDGREVLLRSEQVHHLTEPR